MPVWLTLEDKLPAALATNIAIRSIRLDYHDRDPVDLPSHHTALSNSRIKTLDFIYNEKSGSSNGGRWPWHVNTKFWNTKSSSPAVKTALASGRVKVVKSSVPLAVSTSRPALLPVSTGIPSPARQLDPLWKPMDRAKRSIRISIWTRILSFSMESEDHPTDSSRYPDPNTFNTYFERRWIHPNRYNRVKYLFRSMRISRDLKVR